MRKICFAVLLFFAATAAQADSTNCLTIQAGFSYIISSSRVICGTKPPVTPSVTITPPAPITITSFNQNDQGEDNDDQGQNFDTGEHFLIQPGQSIIFGVSGPAPPVSTPEPVQIWMLALGLAALLMFKRAQVLSKKEAVAMPGLPQYSQNAISVKFDR